MRAWTRSRRSIAASSLSCRSAASFGDPADEREDPLHQPAFGAGLGVPGAGAAELAGRAVRGAGRGGDGELEPRLQRRVQLAGEAVAPGPDAAALEVAAVPVGAHRRHDRALAADLDGNRRGAVGAVDRPAGDAVGAEHIDHPVDPRTGVGNRRGGRLERLGRKRHQILRQATLIDVLRQRGLMPCERAVGPRSGIAANCGLLSPSRACVVLLPWAAGAGPRVVGAPETVFDWSSAACADWDIPDTPARAWRSADGMVHLLAGAEESRASVGPDLDEVEHDCTVLHRGTHSDYPGAYDDRAWIHATYAEGDRVTALAHVEFHGHRRPGLCASRDRGDCWRNAIVELRSDDGGRTFRRVGLVAALPYRYAGEGAGRSGYFNPSNIIRRGDYLYAFVMAERTGAQRRGPCLLRRPLGGGPGDWRGWDGGGFTVRFADPYREDLADPARHVCAPVEGIGSTLSSVVERAGTYLAVTAADARPAGRGRAQRHLLDDLAGPRSLEPAGTAVGGAAALAARLRGAGGLRLSGAARRRQRLARASRRSTTASGSISSRCGSDPAAASDATAT